MLYDDVGPTERGQSGSLPPHSLAALWAFFGLHRPANVQL